MMKRTQRYESAFTLIELLLVIGIIAVLAAIVILAVNPRLQLTKAEDAKRTSTAREIKSAINQYIIDNGFPPENISTTPTPICNYNAVDTSGCINLDALVDENYVVSLQQDVTETDSNLLGYTIEQSTTGFITTTPTYLGQSGGGGGGSTVVSASIVPVESVAFNGEPQRSMMTGAIITFAEEVDIVGNPFVVILRGTGTTVTVTPSSVNSGGKTITTLSFSGPQTEYTSLKNGYYELTIDAASITASDDAEIYDTDYTFGDEQTDKFFRYGVDIDGSGTFDSPGPDGDAYNDAYFSEPGDVNWNPFVDTNNNQFITIGDLQAGSDCVNNPPVF